MVYSVNLKYLSFKQNISKLDYMLFDETSTYAILKYASDIPSDDYKNAMNILSSAYDSLTNIKLQRLVEEFSSYTRK
jgi:hypothetical protein